MKDDIQVHEMNLKNNELEMSLSGESVQLFYEHLIQMFLDTGAENFLTITINRGNEKYALTIQNCNGVDSPTEKLVRLENELKQLSGD